MTDLQGAAYAPAWSPDSRTIAFSGRTGTKPFQLYAIGVDGKGLRRLTQASEDAFEPAWSPDGQTIAYSRAGSIVTIDAGGANVSVLTDPDGNDSSPDWNPHPAEGEEQS